MSLNESNNTTDLVIQTVKLMGVENIFEEKIKQLFFFCLFVEKHWK